MAKRLLLVLTFEFFLLATATKGVAADPARYRTSSPDPRVRQVPAEIQQGAFSDPETFLEPLVKFLVSGGRDDFHKVKILHDWIADNIEYDVDSYFSGAKAESSGTNTLQRRRAVCHVAKKRGQALAKKRGQAHLFLDHSFFGRPRGWSVDSRPSVTAIRFTH